MYKYYREAYKGAYVDNRPNNEALIYALMHDLKHNNYFIEMSIKDLHNAILLNNVYDIGLHLDILIEESRDSMFRTYTVKDSLNKEDFSEDRLTDVLNKLDNIRLRYAALLALAYELKQYVDDKDNDNIDYTLALIYQTYDEILEHVKYLRYI